VFSGSTGTVGISTSMLSSSRWVVLGLASPVVTMSIGDCERPVSQTSYCAHDECWSAALATQPEPPEYVLQS